MRYILLPVLIVLFNAIPLWSQDSCNYSISGYVLDEHNNEPLPYSTVYIEELDRGTVTDSTGAYNLQGLCAGDYTIVCNHIGCDPISFNIRLNRNLKRNFYPEHHSELLTEVSVSGNRELEVLSLNQKSLSGDELAKMNGQPLAMALSEISGVNTFSTGNSISKPIIHGMHSNRVLILNNEIRQEGQQWGNEHAPEVDPFIADEITVVKGAGAARYGPDAIGGVILINPAPLRASPGIGGELNLIGFSNGRQGTASAVLNGNFKKIPALAWRLQGTYKRAGNVKTPDYYLKNTGLKEYNFSWATAYTKENFGLEVFYSQFNTEIGIFSAAHIGNLTDLQRAFNSEKPLESAEFTYEIGRPKQNVEHELFKVKAFLKTGETGRVSFTYARQYNKREEFDKHLSLVDSLALQDIPALQFKISTHTADIAWEHSINRKIKGSIGVNGFIQKNRYAGRFFIPAYDKYTAGIFLLERWRSENSRLILEGGLRFDHISQEVFIFEGNVLQTPQFTYNNFSGTLGGIYRIDDNVLFRLNAGTAWRPPHVNELFSKGLHHGAASVEIGNPSLLPEFAYNLNATAEYLGENIKLQIDGYYNYIKDFIYLKPELPPSLTIRGAFPTFKYSQVNAVLRGLDFSSEVDLPLRFKLESSFSLLRAVNIESGEYLVLMPADRIKNALQYNFHDQRRFRDILMELEMENVFKQWRVPQQSDFIPPPGAYTLLNFNSSFSIPLGEEKIVVRLGINNLMNISYRDYLNRFRYYADEMGTNLSVHLKIPFNFNK